MAKYALAAGIEIDLPDAAERQAANARVIDAVKALSRPPLAENVVASPFVTDAAGLIQPAAEGIEIYRVPTGMSALIARFVVNTAVPTATGILGFYRDRPGLGNLVHISPDSGVAAVNVAPRAYSFSEDSAPIFRAGQRLVVAAHTALAVTTQFSVMLKVELFETPGGADAA